MNRKRGIIMVSPLVRGGRTLRMGLEAVKASTRAKYICSRCGKKAVKRKSTGIWQCKSCNVVFAGGAYAPTTPVGEVAARIISDIAKQQQ